MSDDASPESLPRDGLQMSLQGGNFPGDDAGNKAARNSLVVKVYSNVDQELIEITTDKAHLILRDFQEALYGRDHLFFWSGLFVSLAITLFTADFKDFGGFQKDLIRSCVVITT